MYKYKIFRHACILKVVKQESKVILGCLFLRFLAIKRIETMVDQIKMEIIKALITYMYC